MTNSSQWYKCCHQQHRHGLIACAARSTCTCAARCNTAMELCALAVLLEGIARAARSGSGSMMWLTP
eukprot:5213982-Amphidinium_carterae.1